MTNCSVRVGRKTILTPWSIWCGFVRLAPSLTEEGKRMPAIPTVKIKAGKDYAIINESDFDPATMELFDAAPKPKAKAKAKPKAKK